jgi:hypothetical protein
MSISNLDHKTSSICYKTYKTHNSCPGLLYFTNYHIHGYEGFGLYNKTLDESKQHTKRVFIGQRAAHIDWEHQQNKPDKGLNEKIESNKKRTRA